MVNLLTQACPDLFLMCSTNYKYSQSIRLYRTTFHKLNKRPFNTKVKKMFVVACLKISPNRDCKFLHVNHTPQVRNNFSSDLKRLDYFFPGLSRIYLPEKLFRYLN